MVALSETKLRKHGNRLDVGDGHLLQFKSRAVVLLVYCTHLSHLHNVCIGRNPVSVGQNCSLDIKKNCRAISDGDPDGEWAPLYDLLTGSLLQGLWALFKPSPQRNRSIFERKGRC